MNAVGPLTISEALRSASQRLAQAEVDAPRATAQILLAHLLGKDRTFLITHARDVLDPAVWDRFQQWVEQRAAGVPVQYLTGHQEFYGLDFLVTPDVLIPRPETELIVEEVLNRHHRPDPLIIDVGTGSGCLAVTLAVHLPQARIIALDISTAALKVARQNAQRHGVDHRIGWLVSDLLAALIDRTACGGADFIVANPPYVSTAEFHRLPREVRDHEPRLALLAGPDGLIVHRRLLQESQRCLRPGGYLIMEIGYGQCQSLTRIIDPSRWEVEKVARDLQGIERTFVLRWRGGNG